MNRDVILITQQGTDGPIHICRSTRYTAATTVTKLQRGNPAQLTPLRILLAGEAEHDQLVNAIAGQRIRGSWYHPDAATTLLELPLPRDENYERELRAAAHLRTATEAGARW